MVAGGLGPPVAAGPSAAELRTVAGADADPGSWPSPPRCSGAIRKAKSDAKQSMRADVASVVVSDRPDRLAAIAAAVRRHPCGRPGGRAHHLRRRSAPRSTWCSPRHDRRRPAARGGSSLPTGRDWRRTTPAGPRSSTRMLERCEEGRPTYVDPDTGYAVITAASLSERGALLRPGMPSLPLAGR